MTESTRQIILKEIAVIKNNGWKPQANSPARGKLSSFAIFILLRMSLQTFKMGDRTEYETTFCGQKITMTFVGHSQDYSSIK